MQLLVNIDVPDLRRAETFYTAAFDFHVGRRLGDSLTELLGAGCAVYLLEKKAGTAGAPGAGNARRYARHWSPVHLDMVVPDVEAAVARAEGAGATVETPVTRNVWGSIATLSDPFGNGFCLVQFHGRGYDELVE